MASPSARASGPGGRPSTGTPASTIATEQLEAAGNFNNLRLAAGRGEGEFRGMLFADSDVYKWLEAAAYDLAARPGAKLLGRAEEAIDLVAAAQSDDGYLNSYWQVVEPDRRWQDLGRGHEMYCAGHLMQAAVAYHRATGHGKLLDVARRFADHIDSVFGPTGRPGIPGHPEIETALVELYRHTGEGRYLDLARLLLDRRGRETLNLGQLGPDYFQDHVAVREADTMAGHAVRQLYLAAGAADVYLECGDPAIYEAMMRQWRDMTEHHLFVTGGVGSQHRGEAFGRPLRTAQRELLLRDLRPDRQHHVVLEDAAGHRRGRVRRRHRADDVQRLP